MLRVDPKLVLEDIQNASVRPVLALGEHVCHMELLHALDVHDLFEAGGDRLPEDFDGGFLSFGFHVCQVHLIHSLQAGADGSMAGVEEVAGVAVQNLDHHRVGHFESLGSAHDVHRANVAGDALGGVLILLPGLIRKAVDVVALLVSLLRQGCDRPWSGALAIAYVVLSDGFLLVAALDGVQVHLAGDLTGVVPGVSAALQQELKIAQSRVQDLQQNRVCTDLAARRQVASVRNHSAGHIVCCTIVGRHMSQQTGERYKSQHGVWRGTESPRFAEHKIGHPLEQST
mmetsp:Transcript_57071/g.124823  ORF Transcript_57071/g.124823 Transcript_57071/m.124823 type:complete len:286 (-) Transcript_57071:3-860(-)